MPRRGYNPVPYRRPREASTSSQSVRQHFNKEVVLLAPGSCSLPRGKAKVLLHDKHQIADMVEFNAYWGAREVIRKIEDTFHGVLDSSKPPPR